MSPYFHTKFRISHPIFIREAVFTDHFPENDPIFSPNRQNPQIRDSCRNRPYKEQFYTIMPNPFTAAALPRRIAHAGPRRRVL